MTDLFLKAVKSKLRFQTSKGSLNVEQLFDLGQTELDNLYLSLEEQKPVSKGLLGRKGSKVIEHKLSVVKAVFDSIKEDQELQDERAENKRKKAVYLEAIEKKEVEEMIDGKSSKQLKKELSKL